MIACGGDALIDFVPVATASGEDAFVPRVGGSCLNVAVALSRLGAPVTFIGGVSTDLFGEMIVDRLTACGVAADLLQRSAHETTLAFVRMDGADARYAFYDDNTAGRNWRYDPAAIPLDSLDALHIGSVTLIADPSASAYETLVADARRSALISFDPNCRPSLVADHDAYRVRMARFAAMSHVVRYSAEDMEYLHPGLPETAVARGLHDAGVAVFLVTRGENGATGWLDGARIDVPAREIRVADTIGAGDTFHAAFLHHAREAGLLSPDALARLDRETMRDLLDFATSAAAVTCTRTGCDPPTADALRAAQK